MFSYLSIMLLHAEANSSLGHSLRIVTHINSIPFKHYELVKTHIHIKTVAIKEKERTKKWWKKRFETESPNGRNGLLRWNGDRTLERISVVFRCQRWSSANIDRVNLSDWSHVNLLERLLSLLFSLDFSVFSSHVLHFSLDIFFILIILVTEYMSS